MRTYPKLAIHGRLTLQEVWFQVDIKNISTETLDRVVEGENVDAFAVFDIWTLVNDRDISQLYPEIVSGDFVHLDLSLFNIIGTEDDENSVTSLLSTAKVVNMNSRIYKIQHTGR